MSIGPGKYDDLATWVRKKAKARGGVVVIILDGERGNGMSVQCAASKEQATLLARALRWVADQIERDMAAAVDD